MWKVPSFCLLVLLQLCFDFMESADDGKLYCIECNPRTSSVITEFHDNPALATGESRYFSFDLDRGVLLGC